MRLLWLLPLMLAGCASVGSHPYAPTPLPAKQAIIESLEWTFLSQDWLDDYLLLEREEQTEARNNFLSALIVLSDLAYYDYEARLFGGSATANTVMDVLALSLTTAATITSGEALKSTLAAIATAILGTRQVINREFLADQSINALMLQMRALRETQLSLMIVAMRQPASTYSLLMGLRDVLEYIHLGSITSAIAEMTHQAARQSEAAKSRRQDISMTDKSWGPSQW